MSYEGTGRDLVMRHKRGGAGRLIAPLAAALLLAGAAALSEADSGGAVVTWAPTTPRRRRCRGRDHAEELCRAVAAGANVEAIALLARREGRPQHGASRADRLSGPMFAVLSRPANTVVLVDDVVTTGATMSAAAEALRAAGARTIVGMALARRALPPASMAG